MPWVGERMSLHSRGLHSPPAACTLHHTPPGPSPVSCALHTLCPAPYTLHPIPCTLHPASCDLHTLHSAPYTLHPTSCTPYALCPAPYNLHPMPCALHPTPPSGEKTMDQRKIEKLMKDNLLLQEQAMDLSVRWAGCGGGAVLCCTAPGAGHGP